MPPVMHCSPTLKTGRTILLTCASILLLFSGCATLPEWTAGQWISVLPEGCAVYFSIGFSPAARQIARSVLVSLGESSSDSTALVERMDRVYGAVEIASDGTSRLHVVVEGRFPSVLMALSMGADARWQRKQSSREYWVSQTGPLQVCLPQSSIALVSTSDVVPMIRNYDSLPGAADQDIPEIVARDMQSSELVVYFPDFGEGPLAEAAGLALPLRHIWIKADRNELRYDLQGFFELESEKNARSFDRVLRVLLVYLLRQGQVENWSAKLKDLDLRQSGTLFSVSGLGLSSEELTRILVKLTSAEG